MKKLWLLSSKSPHCQVLLVASSWIFSMQKTEKERQTENKEAKIFLRAFMYNRHITYIYMSIHGDLISLGEGQGMFTVCQ